MMQDYLTKLKKAGINTLGMLVLGTTALFGNIAYAAEATESRTEGAKAAAESPEAKKEEKTSLEDKVYKMMVSRKVLQKNPAIMNILTYKQDGEEFLGIPPQLLDFEYSEESPEIKRVELIERIKPEGDIEYSLRRHYVEKKKGREFHDEVPIDRKTIELFMDYKNKEGFDQDKAYTHSLYPAIGVDVDGLFAEVGYRYEWDDDTSFALRVRIGDDSYEIDIEAANKNRMTGGLESVIVGRSAEEIEDVGEIPDFERRTWAVSRLERHKFNSMLARLSFSEEEIEKKALRGKKYGEWEEGDYEGVEFGESFVTRNNLGIAYKLGHDGRDFGGIVTFTHGKNKTDQARRATNFILTERLYSGDHDSTVTGIHSNRWMVDVGYWHGEPMAEGTVWLLDGRVALFTGIGRSTDTWPMEEYGEPGGSYSGIVFGPDAIMALFEKMAGAKEEKQYEKSIWKEALRSINIRLTVPHDGGDIYWKPTLHFRELGRGEKYDTGW